MWKSLLFLLCPPEQTLIQQTLKSMKMETGFQVLLEVFAGIFTWPLISAGSPSTNLLQLKLSTDRMAEVCCI